MVKTGTVTRSKAAPPAKRAGIDNPKHDDLVLWLKDNLAGLAAGVAGRDLTWARANLAAALQEYHAEVGRALANYERWVAEARTGTLRNALHAKLNALRAYVQETAPPSLGESELLAQIAPEVAEWTMQAPLVRFERDRRGALVRLPAGYIDLDATVELPQEITVTWHEHPYDPSEVMFVGFGDAERPRVADQVRDIEREQFVAPTVSIDRWPQRLWFYVLSRPGTLTELLVALKDLRALKADPEPTIVVVMTDMLTSWKEVLRHEGFAALDRGEWDVG